MRKPVPGSTRSWASGSRSSASSAPCERVAPVLVGPQQQHRRGDARVDVQQLAPGFARAVAREAGPRPREVHVAAHVGERVADQVARGGVAARAQLHAAIGAERGLREMGQGAVDPGHRAGAAPAVRQCSLAAAGGAAASGMSTSASGIQQPALDRAQQHLRAEVVPGDQRARPGRVQAERRRAPRRASRACRGGAGGPRSRRAAAGRAARRGSARRGRRRRARTRGG